MVDLGFVADVVAIISFLLLLGGYVLYYYQNYYKAIKNYNNRLFRDHVNFSLNYIGPGKTLKMRTLEESKATNIFASEVLINKINDASKHTTVEDVFLSMKNQGDQEYMLRSVLNFLSSRFGRGFLADAFGDEEAQLAKEKEFVVGVTYEVPAAVRKPPIASKIRVMVISEDDLQAFFVPEVEPTPDKFQLESRWHANRIETLRQMAEHVNEKNAWQNGETFIPRIYTMKLAMGP